MFSIRPCLPAVVLAVTACSGSSPTGSATSEDRCAGVACTALDACHLIGTCDPATGACSTPAQPDGTSCDDGDGCTLADACQAGVCTASAARACPAPDACHDAGTCDAATGGCFNPPRPDATPCDDGSLCTTADECRAGVCVGSSALTCTSPDACHAPGSCNPITGACTEPVYLEGASCALTGSVGVCRAGACAPAEGYEGSYHIHGLTTGTWNGWGEGTATVDRTGVVTDYREDFSDGTYASTSPFPRVLVDAAGRVTIPFYPSYWGTLSANGAEALSSYADPDGSAVLVVHQRQAIGVSAADLAGTWNLHALTVGIGANGDAWWYRGGATVDGSGAVARTLTDRLGNVVAESFGMRIEPGGAVRRVYPLLAAERGGAALSPGGQLLAGVWTPLEGGAALEVAVLAGAAPVLADLAGDWSFHVLSAADVYAARTGAGHGAFAVDAAGAMTLVHQAWTAPDLALPEGTLAVDANGALHHSAMTSFAGNLSADGEILVASFTWNLGGDALLVAQRRRVPPVKPVLESAATATAPIGDAGGSLQAVASDGTTYLLDLPAGALEAGRTVDISVTPIASLPDLPVNGTLLGAAQLSPDGLQLLLPARLTIGKPGGVPAEVIGFTYPGPGLDRVSFMPAGAPGTIALDLVHFSGVGAAEGSAAGQADADQAFADQLAAIAQVQGLGAVAAFEVVFDAWLDAIITGVRNAGSFEHLMNGLAVRMERWSAARQRLGLEGSVCVARPGRAADLKGALDVEVASFIADVETACRAEPTPCGKLASLRKLLAWNAMIQSWGAAEGCLGLAQTPVCGVCGEAGDALPASATIHCDPPPAGQCLGTKLQAGESVSLRASFLDTCGGDAGASDTNPNGAFPDWRSTRPEVASVSAFGHVTGVDLGTALIELRVAGMPCLPPAVAKAFVFEGARRYLVTVTDMTITSTHVDCGLVTAPPEPYVINFTVDDAGMITVTPFTGFIDEYTAGSQNRWLGGLSVFRTTAYNFYFPLYGHSPLFLIERDWRLQGGTDLMTGYYDWGWMGEYLSGRYTGCHGRNEVRLDPWPLEP